MGIGKKILEIIIGDLEKWKKVPEAMKQFGNELKTPGRERRILILIGIVSFGIVFGLFYTIGWVQYSAQYCQIIESEETIVQIDNKIMNTGVFNNVKMINETEIKEQVDNKRPKNNESYNYYRKFYEEGKPPWIGFNCTWDMGRFMNEIKTGELKIWGNKKI